MAFNYKKTFIGFENQKYRLNQILAAKPQMIVLDEAFNAMDSQTAKAICKVIPTVVLISHD